MLGSTAACSHSLSRLHLALLPLVAFGFQVQGAPDGLWCRRAGRPSSHRGIDGVPEVLELLGSPTPATPARRAWLLGSRCDRPNPFTVTVTVTISAVKVEGLLHYFESSLVGGGSRASSASVEFVAKTVIPC